MERGDAAMERESSPPPSRSSSGCQSGWTLYLDHSNGGAVHYIPCDPAAAQRWMVPRAQRTDGVDEDQEDSMLASDASSRPRREEEDEASRRDFEIRHGFFVDQRSYSSTSGGYRRSRSSASDDSGCFGSSTWSRSSQGGLLAKGGVARTAAAVVFQGEGTATRPQYREVVVIDDDDEEELDDTASSSAVFSCPVPMVHGR